MAEEIKAEFQRAMEKKRSKTAEIEVDEFEWIQVRDFLLDQVGSDLAVERVRMLVFPGQNTGRYWTEYW